MGVRRRETRHGTHSRRAAGLGLRGRGGRQNGSRSPFLRSQMRQERQEENAGFEEKLRGSPKHRVIGTPCLERPGFQRGWEGQEGPGGLPCPGPWWEGYCSRSRPQPHQLETRDPHVGEIILPTSWPKSRTPSPRGRTLAELCPSPLGQAQRLHGLVDSPPKPTCLREAPLLPGRL